LAIDVAWILDGAKTIALSQDIDCPQTLTNKIAMLARQVKWGAPAEALDILRIAQRQNVPGFGRQRATSLIKAGLTTLDGIIALGREGLSKIIGGDTRSEALLRAVISDEALPPERLQETHIALADRLGIGSDVRSCYESLGDEYEQAAFRLLGSVEGFSVSLYDDGKRQNVSDIFLECGDDAAFIECKTTTRRIPLIRKEEAFAVLQKSADVEERVRRICLGKPHFDETAKLKAQSSRQITLIENAILIEGVLRHLSGEFPVDTLSHWLCQVGVTEMERLPGRSTPELLEAIG
jgi:helicase